MKTASLLFLVIICLTPGSARGETPSGDEILTLVDKASVADCRIVEAEMTIHTRRDSRTIGLKSWIRGDSQSFSEYLYPPREAGTKMLKLKDELWTYSPSTDRVVRIAGHMLRQSVMGSDLSYEDMMEDHRLRDVYDAEVTGEETMLERDCWVVKLIANVKDIAYYTREILVDKTRHIVLKESRFGKSGTLLKTTAVQEVKRLSGRWVPTQVVFRDELKGGKGTEFTIKSIQFDAKIPDYIFSKASLRQ